jgi:hypothetical protein
MNFNKINNLVYDYLFNQEGLEGSKIPSYILNDCKKIKENYKIKNEDILLISQARDFIRAGV